MGNDETITKYEAPKRAQPTAWAGACDMIVAGVDGAAPLSTIPAAIYLSTQSDGRTLVQIKPTSAPDLRRYRSWNFIVTDKAIATKESKR